MAILTTNTKNEDPEKPEFLEMGFCENSSIHGMKYMYKTKGLLQRVLWFVTLLMSFCLSAFLIGRLYTKRSIIVTFNEAPIPIWQIPFPAVTICPETKARNNEFRFTDTFLKLSGSGYTGNVTKRELDYFNTMVQLCDDQQKTLVRTRVDSNHIRVIQQLAPFFNDTLLYCYFRSAENRCKDIFTPTITDAGLCYTFNGLSKQEIYRVSELADDFLLEETTRVSRTEWSIDDGYGNGNVKIYPERGLETGVQAGFTGILSLNEKDFDYICRETSQGFQIMLHNPAEQPSAMEEYHKLQLGTELTIKIHPKITVTTSNLLGYPPHERGCLFSRERRLRFFQIYTKCNCEIECISNYTLSKCGCVKFHMPRDRTTRVCGASDMSCCNKAQYELLQRKLEEEIKGDHINKCNCLPGCNSLEYDAGVTDVMFNWKDHMKASKESMEHLNNSNLAKVNIFFKTGKVVAHKRSELYSTIDFLANCGGLIGMFMGASVISVIEIVYFCWLGFFTHFRRLKKHSEIILVKPIVK